EAEREFAPVATPELGAEAVRCRGAIILAITGAAFLSALTAAGWLGGLRINLTPSYPLGLWRIEALQRPVANGDLVFICPPITPAFAKAFERGYIRRGLCPGRF